MSAAWKRRLAEFGKFLTVGGLATLVSLIIFNLLVHDVGSLWNAPMPDQPIFAYVLANSVGMLISYQGSRNWAFSDRVSVHRDGGFTAYMVINLATFVLPMACLWFSRDVLMRTDPVSDNVAANVIGAALGTMARYYLFRTLVFRRPVPLVDMYDELGEVFEEGEPLVLRPVSSVVEQRTRRQRPYARAEAGHRSRVVRLCSKAMAKRAPERSPENATRAD